jgi:hypothetical protein
MQDGGQHHVSLGIDGPATSRGGAVRVIVIIGIGIIPSAGF